MKKRWEAGNPCKKCETPVKLHKDYGDTGHYEKCFICPSCSTVYFRPRSVDVNNKKEYAVHIEGEFDESDNDNLEVMSLIARIMNAQRFITDIPTQAKLLRQLAKDLEESYKKAIKEDFK